MSGNFVAALGLSATLLVAATSAQSAILRFDIAGANATTGQSIDLQFDLDTDAPLTNMPASEFNEHQFGNAGLVGFSAEVRDASNTVEANLGVDLTKPVISVTQSRVLAFNQIWPGSNILSVQISGEALTGTACSTCFFDINLTSSPVGSFGSQSDDYVSNLLFNDPTMLMSGYDATRVLTMSNFTDGGDAGSTGITSSLPGIASFLFSSVSVSDITPITPPPPNPPAVPLPASGWLLLGSLGALAARRRRSA